MSSPLMARKSKELITSVLCFKKNWKLRTGDSKKGHTVGQSNTAIQDPL